MQKAKTAAWKAKSTRNRHNGKVNADKEYVILHPDTMKMTDHAGKVYRALKKVVQQSFTYGEKEVMLDRITYRIVRA